MSKTALPVVPTPHNFSALLARKPMPVGMVGPLGARWRSWLAAWRESIKFRREANHNPPAMLNRRAEKAAAKLARRRRRDVFVSIKRALAA